MIFHPTPLHGAWLIEPELLRDERGWFARTYDADEFEAHGLDPVGVQCNSSSNARRGTVRGLHYQAEPYQEAKLVRCVRGAIWDVAVDLRASSRTYCRWHAVELKADRPLQYFIPRGMAHGFQTLCDDTEVLYQMGHSYVPYASRGVRWDDPVFGIPWPQAPGGRTISDRDRSYPDFVP